MVLVVFSLFMVFLFFLYMGGREFIGEQITKVFPKEYLEKDSLCHIYLNGKYNRTTLVSNISGETLQIYDAIHLPISYRGRFYAVGVDRNDGSRLVYVKWHKHYKFVRVAELIRKVFNVCNDEHQLPIVEEEEGKEEEDEV